jgi:hypothetical protein
MLGIPQTYAEFDADLGVFLHSSFDLFATACDTGCSLGGQVVRDSDLRN